MFIFTTELQKDIQDKNNILLIFDLRGTKIIILDMEKGSYRKPFNSIRKAYICENSCVKATGRI